MNSISKTNPNGKKTKTKNRNDKYLTDVSRIFSKPQKHHYTTMMESLIELDGKRTISRINQNIIERRDVSCDIKFIRDTDWTKNEIFGAHRAYFKSVAQKADVGFYIIDDTVLEKAGRPKHMEGLGWHYSHSKGRVIYGHSMVSSQYRVGSVSLPYDFQFYRGEKDSLKNKVVFKSKQDIAKAFIREFEPFFNEKIYILLDSWYTSKEVIQATKDRGFNIIGGIKSNRVFRLQENGHKHRISTYVKNLRNTSFEEVVLGEGAFLVRRVECFLPGVGNAVILISKRKKDGSKCFILSTDTSLCNEDILKYYSYRWDIETAYLYCKDRLGLGHYQMRRMKAIEKFCALVFSAFCYLEALRFQNKKSSIGQSRWYFRLRRKQHYVEHIVKLAREGVPLKKIYEELNLVA